MCFNSHREGIHRERNQLLHNHWFAWIKTATQPGGNKSRNLPPSVRFAFPSSAGSLTSHGDLLRLRLRLSIDYLALMGFLQNTISLLIGTGCGIYIAQNYDVPNMKKLMCSLMGKAKEAEESYKKLDKNKD
ncbi:hypothetical protein GUJ93_ZPchr0005g16064 [Zizania palustris]|uniref:Uncharacterized protein n=1 Tax=Zizania palustris TaxID=103762 RepID=A0A8J5SEW6_ZIZPA|nr:hypothetical protein GUJ93_ZPchr0005g16064 [Zizania palustris]